MLADIERGSNAAHIIPSPVSRHMGITVKPYCARPADIPYAETRRLYADAVNPFGPPTELPLSEPAFRRALAAEGMIRASQGLGGPQPAEVARMLAS
ncbi:hypothetical protein [Candidatus Entotheonella palauensis]|uniref:hypothetical protein n=1 Tax=Candidatus Entotheonella palauensis TaxID=93172 RepID=UPI0015C40FF9|nr:hypothetical protein [Candidatus Entotheonella palauensis]